MTDMSKYLRMRDEGAKPADVFLAATQDGVDKPSCYNLLHQLFGLTFVQSKEIIHTAQGQYKSLADAQERLVDAVHTALELQKARDEERRKTEPR
jgi:hypothetical protein